jgi:hypothetical protein
MKSLLVLILTTAALTASMASLRGADDECQDYYETLWNAFLYDAPSDTYSYPNDFTNALRGIMEPRCQKVQSPKCDLLHETSAAASQTVLDALTNRDYETFSAHYLKLWVQIQGYLINCVNKSPF